MRALESELGVALFTRGHRGVHLTTADSTLRELAADVLRNAETLRELARSFGYSGSVIALAEAHLSPLSVPDRTVSALRGLTMSDVDIELVEPGWSSSRAAPAPGPSAPTGRCAASTRSSMNRNIAVVEAVPPDTCSLYTSNWSNPSMQFALSATELYSYICHCI